VLVEDGKKNVVLVLAGKQGALSLLFFLTTLNFKLNETSYICARQVLHDQLLLNPPRAGTQQE